MKFIPHTYLATREVPPTVTTGTINSNTITGIYARMEGSQVTSDGGGTVTARGVVWSTSQNPTVNLSTKTVDGSGLGVFGSDIEGSGLTNNTTYYVRAYATNSAGTSYGNQISFTTDTVPTVTTSVSNIAATTATMSGNVTSDGGATVSSRGIAYNTSGTPTTSDTSITVGSGTGAFTTNVTGLTAGTAYYARAWAINNIGIAYGNQVGFSTPNPQPPSVTAGYTAVGGNQYQFYVTINSIGSATPTEVGVIVNGTTYYSSYGGGTGTFEAGGILGPFSACTVNSYTAFATNTVGTGTSGGSITISGTPPTANNISNDGSSRSGNFVQISVYGTYTSGDLPVTQGTLYVEGPPGWNGSATAVSSLNFSGGNSFTGYYSLNSANSAGQYTIYAVLQNNCGQAQTPNLTITL